MSVTAEQDWRIYAASTCGGRGVMVISKMCLQDMPRTGQQHCQGVVMLKICEEYNKQASNIRRALVWK